MQDNTRCQSINDAEVSQLLEIIESEVFARQADDALPHVGSVLLELSTQHRLPGPAALEALRQQMQQAITTCYQSDDDVFSDYMGFLPGEESNDRLSAFTTRRLIVPFLADVSTRNTIREQNQQLSTRSPLLWHLRNSPKALIRRYYVVDRKKTCLNTLRVRLNKTIKTPNDTQADLYVIGLHGNGDNSHGILQNTLSVVYNNLIRNRAVDIDAVEVLSFDFRGSIASPGTHHECLDDLVDQAVDQVLDLLNQDIPAEKIVLHGHSLGGYIGVIAAHQLMTLGFNIHYFGDRLPNSLADVAATFVPSVLAGSARFFSQSICSPYQRDTSELYLELLPTHRACLVSKADKVILFEASLVGVLRIRHGLNEGIIIEDLDHNSNLGYIGADNIFYNPDDNPFFQFLVQRIARNRQHLDAVVPEEGPP